MWELDHKEGWTLKNWCFWTVVLEKILECPLDYKEIKPVNPKGNQTWRLIGRIMLKLNLKLWYFGHPMWRANSLEKTLMPGNIEGRRRRGQQRMRWLNGITNSMGMNLTKFWEVVKNCETWCIAVHEVTKSWTWLSYWTTIIIDSGFGPNSLEIRSPWHSLSWPSLILHHTTACPLVWAHGMDCRCENPLKSTMPLHKSPRFAREFLIFSLPHSWKPTSYIKPLSSCKPEGIYPFFVILFFVSHCYKFVQLHFNHYFKGLLWWIQGDNLKAGLIFTAMCLTGRGKWLPTWQEVSEWLWNEKLWNTIYEREQDFWVITASRDCVYLYELFIWASRCNQIFLKFLNHCEVPILGRYLQNCGYGRRKDDGLQTVCLSRGKLDKGPLREAFQEMPTVLFLGNWISLGL